MKSRCMLGAREASWLLAIEPWGEAHEIPAGVAVMLELEPDGSDHDWEFLVPDDPAVMTVGMLSDSRNITLIPVHH